MNNQGIRWVILLGLTAVIGILCFQGYWMTTNYNSKREIIQQQIRIILYKVAEGIAESNQSTLPLHNLITQRSSNYYIVNINDHIDAFQLENLILEEMKRVGLELDFEYAIYDCERDEMVYGQYCSIADLPQNSASASLQKYDHFDYYFGVRFPQLALAIAGEMSLTLVLSGLLLITLIFFGTAIYTILYQRKYSERQSDFINNMTHELKTPLSSIKIAGDTFLNDALIQGDARLHKYAQIVSEQSGRLNDHVEKILDIARLERDLVKLNNESVNLVKLLDRIVLQYNHAPNEKTVRIHYEHEVDEQNILADPLHLSNVFYNLIDNAIKYCRESARITLKLSRTANSTIVSVSDNGLGIASKELVKIFDKFYRIPTGNVHDTKGFGLGLYYVHQIVKLHSWHIQVESIVDKGSTFTITIPDNKSFQK